jgi:hypothetical protein
MSTYDYNESTGFEPSLHEVMNEPIVQLLMRRDHVRERDLWPMLRQTSERLSYFLGFRQAS